MNASEGSREEYLQLLDEHETVILVTHGDDGELHCRPMAMQGHRGGEEIWLATYADSDKCRHVAQDDRVALSFHAGEHEASWLSVSGRCEIVHDRAKIRELWDASWKPWFPDGPEQADLVLLRIVPEHAEWVKPEGGKLKVLYTMAKRAATGSRDEPGEKHALDLH
jgi:general stress protein 26